MAGRQERIAYFDCFSGISGDMALGALIDAGACVNQLREGLKTIPTIEDEWELTTAKVVKSKGHIAALKATVESIYDHKALPAPSNDSHDHSHHHDHEDSHHSHEHHHAEGPSRNLSDITKLISSSGLPESVKEKSLRVFQILAEAEALTHGTSIDKVHFHEVGAVDSIVDTVGTVLALHLLQVDQVYASPLPFGQGMIHAAHGLMPVPAPATLQILRDIPTSASPLNVKGELVTPTGASLMKALVAEFGPAPSFTPKAIGIGAGSKDFPQHPNILRVIIGDRTVAEDSESSYLICLETNIDDMTPQVISYVCERLMEKGALDCWTTPILMKKGRPAFMLSVLCKASDQDSLRQLLFRETSTLGVRKRIVERQELQRELMQVHLPPYDCTVRVKVGRLHSGEVVNIHAEYEDCKDIAKSKNVPLSEIMLLAEEETRKKLLLLQRTN